MRHRRLRLYPGKREATARGYQNEGKLRATLPAIDLRPRTAGLLSCLRLSCGDPDVSRVNTRPPFALRRRRTPISLPLILPLSLFLPPCSPLLFFPAATTTSRRPLCIKPFEPNNPCRLQFSDSGVFFFSSPFFFDCLSLHFVVILREASLRRFRLSYLSLVRRIYSTFHVSRARDNSRLA